MKVSPGAGTVRIEDNGGHYEVRAGSPAELRGVASQMESRALRRNDRREMERAVRYRRAADIWEAQQAEEAQRKRAGTKAKRASTQRRKDEFTGAYGSGAEQARARKRLGWEDR